MLVITVLLGITGIAIAVVLYVTRKKSLLGYVQSVEIENTKRIEMSQKEAQNILTKAHASAQDILANSRIALEEESRLKRQAVTQIEERVMQKEKHLDSRESRLAEKESVLNQEIEQAKTYKKRQETLVAELSSKLEQIAEMSAEDARKLLLSNVEREVRQRAGKMIKDVEEQTKKIANRRAKEIVTDAIQRTAVDHVMPATTSVVQLQDDDMKGRIIGREGRNIRAFESVTGVDVIIDDTPGAVILSCFDPIRREIARMALDKLVADGRIHPARIEEMVDKSRKELQDIIREHGERAADEIGLQFHPKIIELLGKLHYRTSYGQNILAHSLEAAHIAGIMAAELKVNVNLAKRGTMLHDIGKALDFEQEGSHDDLGKEVCIKYGESPEVINCIMAHHEGEEPDTIEAVLVMMADAISAVRPGARRESLETYIKRLEKLEAIAHSFEGVDKAYAIQAGREVRVIVKPDIVDDNSTHKLAFDIAKRIETDMDYPGEVRVSIIRETRASSVAK